MCSCDPDRTPLGPSYDAIETVSALEACIGKVPRPIDLKVIDHLDKEALRWIAASPMLFVAFGDDLILRDVCYAY
ncbi:MAG: hypothetical protein JSS39_06115 [Nitrospira sp.]|nr:hypothetical protein [Nitrospira sp.]